MKVTVISSGSKGNSTLVETKSKNILIDAGISSKEIKKRLNKDINIDLLFITHAHIDHIKGLKSVYKEFKPTVFTRNEEVIEKNICDITYFDKPYILDDLEVSYFNLSHDSDCIGIKIKENNKELVYITDTGYINKKILTTIVNKDMYIIESNHDVELLMNGKYPFFLQQRILSDKGHLSNKDCSRYLSTLIGNKTKYIVLAHLSEENNTKELASFELNKMLEKNNFNIKKTYIAKQDESLETIEV